MMEKIVEKANNNLSRFEVPEKFVNLDSHWKMYLRKSDEDGMQQVLSPPEPPTHMPASISLWKVSHIFGHFSETSSKSPKPSNSSHSILLLAFLSADSTKDNKTILWMQGHTFRRILHLRQFSHFGKVSKTGVSRCVRDATTLGGSPSCSNLPTR